MAFDTRFEQGLLEPPLVSLEHPGYRADRPTPSVASSLHPVADRDRYRLEHVGYSSSAAGFSARYPASMVARSRMLLMSCINRCELSRMPRLEAPDAASRSQILVIQYLGDPTIALAHAVIAMNLLQAGGRLLSVAFAQRPQRRPDILLHTFPSGSGIVASCSVGNRREASSSRSRPPRRLRRRAIIPSRTAGQSPASL